MAKILDLVVEEAVFVQRIGRLDSAAVRDLEGNGAHGQVFGIWAKAFCVKKEGQPPKGRSGNGAFCGIGQTASLSLSRAAIGARWVVGELWVVTACSRDGPGFDG